ncbi:hypothetical protein C2845_PM01G42350 [Panicum miliaceum]|uniref:Transposase-associated domain-containing protein n=1 Tax=Panicum miliaceum TaxID=4540 RepID=A0A3L6TSG5_PANMI|nr:hypothetical protein C2845_PM01G42350 [Panicum miliaceum]
MADRRWMYLENPTCEEYLSGLKSFISAAEADKLNRCLSAMCCPCIDCENVRKFLSSLHVHAHLIIRGFMDDYFCWNEHGEDGFNDRGLQGGRMGEGISASQQTACQDGDERLLDSPTCQNDEPKCNNHTAGDDISEDELVDIGDNYVNIANKMEKMVRDAMSYDGYTSVEFEKLQKMVRDMKMPLYPVSSLQGKVDKTLHIT